MSSYFAHAPITKGLVFLSGVLSVLANVFNAKQVLLLDKVGLENYEVWRLLTSRFLFLGTGDMMFGLILLYKFRVFEQHMGSRKYGAFMLISLLVSTLLESIIVILDFNKGIAFSGPCNLIFAQLVQFFYDIPTLSPNLLNDKTITYLIALQLIFAQYPSSGYQAFCGIVAGLLYRIEFLCLENLEFPLFISKFCKTYIYPLLYMAPSTTPSRPQQQQQQQPQHQNYIHNNNMFEFEGIGNYYTIPQPTRQPSVQNIETMTNMGIDREIAIQALQRYNDELQPAIDSLLFH
jgi:membrane associated rhomboid family serine protease